MKKIAIVGAGNWGTALAHAFAVAGHHPTVWGRDPKTVKEISHHHENRRYLPGLKLDTHVKATTDLEKLVSESEIIVCSVPAQNVRKVFSPLGKSLNKKVLINASKGIEIGTHKRMSEVFQEIAPKSDYFVLSGPSFAEEVVKGLPTAITLAGKKAALCKSLQKNLSYPTFRIYTSTDVLGVELCGALKNVIAIASGVVAGLGLGHNSSAAVITRGLAEIARLGKKLGAKPLTFLGLSGMGDLVLTCTGPLSRNRKLGEALAKGKTFEAARSELGGVAEGYYTTKAGYEWAKNLKVDMPILHSVYQILYEGASAKDALTSLMTRNLKDELG